MATLDMPAAVKTALQACTPLQRRFITHYCGRARGNGSLAAKLAGLVKAGAHPVTVASRASQLLKEPKVRVAVEAWMTAYALSGAELTHQLVDLAQANLGPFIEISADGTLRLKVRDDEAWEAYKHWIKAIKTDPATGAVIEVVLHDALAARRELAKILKLYSDAPISNFYLTLRNMSDAELMQKLAEARAAARSALALSPN